jgi:hypothetical protein
MTALRNLIHLELSMKEGHLAYYTEEARCKIGDAAK